MHAQRGLCTWIELHDIPDSPVDLEAATIPGPMPAPRSKSKSGIWLCAVLRAREAFVCSSLSSRLLQSVRGWIRLEAHACLNAAPVPGLAWPDLG